MPSHFIHFLATTAPPQNVSLSVNGSKVSVLWQPPPADWQTGPILEYEVKTLERANYECVWSRVPVAQELLNAVLRAPLHNVLPLNTLAELTWWLEYVLFTFPTMQWWACYVRVVSCILLPRERHIILWVREKKCACVRACVRVRKEIDLTDGPSGKGVIRGFKLRLPEGLFG